MSLKSLNGQHHYLADVSHQLDILNGDLFHQNGLPTFQNKLSESGLFPLKPTELEIFQMNVGYMCNQTCKHCHVDAGPDRKEIMSRDTMKECLEVIINHNIKSVDLTGGAPEMNPNFRWFIEELRKEYNGEVIVRCNLTIIMANPQYHDLPHFYKEHNIRVVSSLPFYNADKTDRQRGKGVFTKSIDALVKLNEMGYGEENSGLILDLVYNPSGAFLPSDQTSLENDFKKELWDHFGISFNSLLTITNLPISRFLDYLVESGNYEDYMEELVMAYNPMAAHGVMCRNTLSIDYNGYLYDCDFNQMLNMKINHPSVRHIRDFDLYSLQTRDIATSQHCFGCTAGAGSSCQGATA